MQNQNQTPLNACEDMPFEALAAGAAFDAPIQNYAPHDDMTVGELIELSERIAADKWKTLAPINTLARDIADEFDHWQRLCHDAIDEKTQ